MLIITCIPVPGFDVYRCGFREEVREGRTVRVGLSWPSGETRLPDDALTPEQIDALKRDPGKRISLRHVPEKLPVDSNPPVPSVELTPPEASSGPSSALPAHASPAADPTLPEASSGPSSALPAHASPAADVVPLEISSALPGSAEKTSQPAVGLPKPPNRTATTPQAAARGPPAW